MAAPTQSFRFYDYLKYISFGTYEVFSVTRETSTVQDISNGTKDDLTQLGDITDDQFNVLFSGQNNPLLYTYESQTSNGSIIAFSGRSKNYPYILLTNVDYAPRAMIDGDFTPHAVCFAAGTAICTTRGDVAVEALAIGDLVVTAAGAHRPIRWLGHRKVDCRRHPRPSEVRPVRIAAHAFGPNRPARDLRVSPGHAICVDVLGEVLIPAGALVNGSTIQQVEVDEVTYWHVELECHDILLAENLPAESYIDMGNRGFFREAAVVDLAAGPDGTAHSLADYCRPYHAGGPIVETARAQLQARMEAVRQQQIPLQVAS